MRIMATLVTWSTLTSATRTFYFTNYYHRIFNAFWENLSESFFPVQMHQQLNLTFQYMHKV